MLLKGLELDPEKRWQTMNPLKGPARDSGRADLLPAGTRLGTSYQIECLQWESRTLRNYLAWDGGPDETGDDMGIFPVPDGQTGRVPLTGSEDDFHPGGAGVPDGTGVFFAMGEGFPEVAGRTSAGSGAGRFFGPPYRLCGGRTAGRRSAAERAAQQEQIDAEQVFSALQTAARGAAAIHAGGTILEEIVPEQLLWREDGRVQLAGLFARKVEEELSKIIPADDVPPDLLRPIGPWNSTREIWEKRAPERRVQPVRHRLHLPDRECAANALERERALRTGRRTRWSFRRSWGLN